MLQRGAPLVPTSHGREEEIGTRSRSLVVVENEKEDVITCLTQLKLVKSHLS